MKFSPTDFSIFLLKKLTGFLVLFKDSLSEKLGTNKLRSVVRDIIEKDGPITIERYMEIVLHHPEYGYYRRGNPLGALGDFATSPEISQLFGEMLAVWCVETWAAMEKPSPFVLLELGPGRGTLMQDILSSTKNVPGFHEALQLYFLESNVTLRGIQTEKLKEYLPHYLERLDQIPSLPVIALANEFFDTIPMRQFIKTDSGWRERLIDYKNGAFVFTFGDEIALKKEGAVNSACHDLKKDDFYEVSPQSHRYLADVATHIAHHGGAGLFIDYGYDRLTGKNTLTAVRKNLFRDNIFLGMGKADVTADVDFIALCKVAEAKGVRSVGPVEQGALLHALGLSHRVEHLRSKATKRQKKKMDLELIQLTHPQKMGTSFRAIGIMNNDLKSFPPFELL